MQRPIAKRFLSQSRFAEQLHSRKDFDLPFRPIAVVIALIAFTTLASRALPAADKNGSSPQFTVLHTFLGEADGASPRAAVTLDRGGNIYGTTTFGGTFSGSMCSYAGCGVAFKIDTRNHENILYTFAGSDGAYPESGLLVGNSGPLYGSTNQGGSSDVGTLFKLQPKATFCGTALCRWNETLLHNFGGGSDGAYASADLVGDAAGNLYGVTEYGGTGNCANGCGTAFKLDLEGNKTILWNFAERGDGAFPSGPLFMDAIGNLYGTTYNGGSFLHGTVFELAPTALGWTERVVYSFTFGTDGASPSGGVISDAHGNLYGTASDGGSAGYGVVFELSPSGQQTVLHAFTGSPDGALSGAKLLFDSSGNLYGTTEAGGTMSGECSSPNGCGTVFELSPNGSGWSETILWSFSGGADGSGPSAPVVMDPQGNLYGTTAYGGDLNSQNPGCAFNTPIGCGVVFRLTP